MDLDSEQSPSEWCKEKVQEYLEKGDEESAMDYFNLQGLWESRGL